MKRKDIIILITRKLPEKIEKKLKENFNVIPNKTDKKFSYVELKKKVSQVLKEAATLGHFSRKIIMFNLSTWLYLSILVLYRSQFTDVASHRLVAPAVHSRSLDYGTGCEDNSQ